MKLAHVGWRAKQRVFIIIIIINDTSFLSSFASGAVVLLFRTILREICGKWTFQQLSMVIAPLLQMRMYVYCILPLSDVLISKTRVA